MTTLEKAIELAKRGFRVHPLKSNSKSPLLSGWQNQATDNIEQVAKWWTKYIDANIGILAGSDLVVIDVDNKNGKNGPEALAEWQFINGALPTTMTVQTPSGGYHLYYKVERPLQNKTNVIEGIDVRGKGGYVVAPGSIINGVAYTIEKDCPPSKANETVYALCEGRNFIQGFELPKTIEQGTRDNTIFKYACSLQGQGYSDEDIYTMVHKANTERCSPPLTEQEVNTKIKSALKYEKGKLLPAEQKLQPITPIRSFDDIEDKEIDWLWYPYIPLGALTILSGAPGTGKTFFVCGLIAQVSNGGFDLKPFVEHKVFIFNAEDDFGATLKKRLKKAGAKLENVFAPEDRGNPLFVPYTLDDERLETLFSQYSPTLAVFDPMQAYLGPGIDINRANQTRPILAKLQALAERHNTAILIVAHLNKMTNQAVFDRVIGSADIIGAARSALFLGKHPKDEGLKILFHMKHNLATKGENLAYIIEGGVWKKDLITDVSELTPEECAGQGKVKKEKSKKALAEKLILEAFKDRNEVSVKELKSIADLNGISWETFKRAEVDGILKGKSRGFKRGEKYFYWEKEQSLF